MATSNKEETTETIKPTEVSPEIPDNWKNLPLADMVDKGWRPRVKETGDRAYMTMRYGSQERSLGPYSEERWNLLMTMFPKLRAVTHRVPPPSKGSLLTMAVDKPLPLKPSANISIKTLAWYEWAQNRGYVGTLGDFLNDVVDTYFRREGLSVVILRESSIEGGKLIGN